MSQYLLLRDNKQSGPHTFEELTAKGLKAYDLIWIEGKSAAWRYPSEIQELKPFAPVVEEQPYDRFYKRQNTTTTKSSETSNTTSTSTLSANNTSNTIASNATSASTDNASVKKTYTPAGINRRIVIILPGGVTNATRDNQNDRVVFHETVENKIAQPERKTAAIPVGDFDDIPSPGYGKPASDPNLVEFKKAPVVTSRETSKRKSGLASKTSKIFASTLVLLTIGVFIGWAFNHTMTSKQTVVPIATPRETIQIPEARTVYNNETVQSVQNPVTPDENQLDQAAMDMNQAGPDSIALETVSEQMVVKKPVAKAKKPVVAVQLAEVPTASNETGDHDRLETTPVSNDKDDAEKKVAKKNMTDLIKVSRNDFKIGPFGGISNLQLKVTNNSAYPVDLVVVEVKYLLANKKEFKTENVYFKNLAPGASITTEAPKSSRGISVTPKVALITSKALGMYQASL